MKLHFPWKRSERSGFAAEMIRSFPPTLPPPEPLVDFFHWLESENLDEVSVHDGRRYARLDPAQRGYGMTVSPVDPEFAVAWSGDDNPEAAARMAAFVRTGGDGSYAGLWRDDDGQLSFVHHGSGSGSTLLCKLTDDPVDFLRLLAIGYEELCWPESFELTPAQAYAKLWGDDDHVPAGPAKPEHLQSWISNRFDVTIPSVAAEIVKSTADMDDVDADDSFWRWIRKQQS